jgi:hypothetical protein
MIVDGWLASFIALKTWMAIQLHFALWTALELAA